jgi:hypothetical protein
MCAVVRLRALMARHPAWLISNRPIDNAVLLPHAMIYLKGCVHLRFDMRFDLRFGACVVTPMQDNAGSHALALACQQRHRMQVKSQVKTQVNSQI